MSTNCPLKLLKVPPVKVQLKFPDKFVEELAVMFTTPDLAV
jgi:hypothetical protein